MEVFKISQGRGRASGWNMSMLSFRCKIKCMSLLMLCFVSRGLDGGCSWYQNKCSTGMEDHIDPSANAERYALSGSTRRQQITIQGDRDAGGFSGRACM